MWVNVQVTKALINYEESLACMAEILKVDFNNRECQVHYWKAWVKNDMVMEFFQEDP